MSLDRSNLDWFLLKVFLIKDILVRKELVFLLNKFNYYFVFYFYVKRFNSFPFN